MDTENPPSVYITKVFFYFSFWESTRGGAEEMRGRGELGIHWCCLAVAFDIARCSGPFDIAWKSPLFRGSFKKERLKRESESDRSQIKNVQEFQDCPNQQKANNKNNTFSS
jgi:hypothetical protein